MATVTRSEYVTSVARGVIERLAPEEIQQFDATVEEFDHASWRQRRRAALENEALAIGVDGAVAILTVPALYLLTKIMERMAAHYSQKAADTATSRINRWLRRLFRRPEPVAAQWAPTPDQVTEIRAIGERQARILKLDEDLARTLVNGIVAELVSRRDNPGPAVDAVTDGAAADGRN
jgi:hypothetical protein